MSRVFHFEVPAEDPQRAMSFYSEVFGWSFTQFGGNDYWFCQTGDPSEPGIDGGIMRRNSPQQPVAMSIRVDSIDEACEQLTRHGGEVVVPKMEIPGVGFLAYFKDPDGNIMGLAQMNS